MAAPAEPPVRKGLPPEAYEVVDGDQYRPYVPPEKSLAELTARAVAVGLVVSVVFGAANAYLGLKVGLTVSASIPAAVIAVAVFRALRRGSILETNMVQTIGSAGESVAAGVIFTLPALFIWQRSDPAIVVDLLQVSVIAGFGGVLGVLFMIPLRRYLIAREHGKLPYPEGTACAEVQVAGEVGGGKARLLFSGLGVGALYQALANSRGLALWNEEPALPLPRKAEIGGSFTPELLGVGFIIGPRIAAIMFGGSALAWLVLIPLIDLWGGDAVVYPAGVPMSALGSGEIWNNYIRYVGAGAVGFAGIVTLLKSLPTIVESFKLGLAHAGGGADAGLPRTQQDLPMRLVLGLAALMAVALWLWPGVPVGPLGALLIVVFSFFFVTVSSRIVGLIGSSSNPVSGMTIAALILTSLIWVALGLNDGGAGAKVAGAGRGRRGVHLGGRGGRHFPGPEDGLLGGRDAEEDAGRRDDGRPGQRGGHGGRARGAERVLRARHGGRAARAPGHADELGDRRRAGRLPALGVRAAGDRDRGGRRVRVQVAFAGVRRRRVPARVADDADLRRRADADGAGAEVQGRRGRGDREARAGRPLRFGADRGRRAGGRADRRRDLRGHPDHRQPGPGVVVDGGPRVDGRGVGASLFDRGRRRVRRALPAPVAGGGPRPAGEVRRARVAVGLALALAAAGACQDLSPDAGLTREAFVETYVALRAAGLQSASGVISPADRERILAERGVDPEELLEFAATHGGNVAFMKEVWDEIESRLEEIRAQPDSSR